jgi:hypothetical protein
MNMMLKAMVVSLLFAGCAAYVEASDLFGTIQLAGKPLSNAEITLKGGSQEQHTKTNQRGYYSVRNLEPGNYTMTIQLQDGSTREAQVYVFPQSTEKNIQIK